jgi:flagellar basal-body rod modification protein FlgD
MYAHKQGEDIQQEKRLDISGKVQRFRIRWQGERKGTTMDSIQQILTGPSQMASSATSVASALAKPRATPPTTPTTTAAAAAASSSTITANDFLTLLVAEMKNQDPTQPTDPNAYITQMVDVNSLQQLIGINSGVTSLNTAAGVVPATTSAITSGTTATANAKNVAVLDAMPSVLSGTSYGTSGTNVTQGGTPMWASGTNS